ncbi:hypothetical protein PROSTU_00676 [Providencia stuartii ATCC 25827]|uniref:Uncharacterized protein n=1 Tax=Providencia stuartii ATCC 25827 TaxID=471874 RepID=A0AA86YQR7_PROST|nr:hypothetical protein PROSTU_04418 [Providencia stuartii ATCC 25827]EDU58722.1 hypothetical protein PROSTU_01899 [Providencia stuartii ATCC 25827]EDU61310.1 hypothetical protein PROSTU_00676 [Providencia stuartii ATCC 25827]
MEYENRNTALQNDTAPLHVPIVYYRRFNSQHLANEALLQERNCV